MPSLFSSFPLLLPLFIFSFSEAYSLQEVAANFAPSESMAPFSKRAFDRLDVSTFDFNKRFNDLDDSSPLAKLFIPKMPVQKENAEQQFRPLRKSKLAVRRRPVARVHGFGLFGPMRFRKRAVEPEEGGGEEKTIYDLIVI